MNGDYSILETNANSGLNYLSILNLKICTCLSLYKLYIKIIDKIFELRLECENTEESRHFFVNFRQNFVIIYQF